ncbi:MAG: hypothetical protein HYY16_16825 [Planctomycetes bacterium]|nr:hypothetical protein [Planctomycetota bacterium]
MEIDGDLIRASIDEIARGTPRAAQAQEGLLDLAGRAPEARDLVFREADRLYRAADRRAEAARSEELALAGTGEALGERDQSRLAQAVLERVECERRRDALGRLLQRLR